MKTKFWKITYLILAVSFSIPLMECVLRFATERAPFIGTVFFVIVRIIQWAFGLIGILMSIGIYTHKGENINTG